MTWWQILLLIAAILSLGGSWVHIDRYVQRKCVRKWGQRD